MAALSFSLLLSSVQLAAQDLDEELLLSTGVFGLAAGFDRVVMDHLGPEHPRWTAPGKLDANMRAKVQAFRGSQDRARYQSDLVAYSMLGLGTALVPLDYGQDWKLAAITQLQTMALTLTVTDLIKLVSARQRPYAYYKTGSTASLGENRSFISAHTSMTCAVATSSATLLARHHDLPEGPLLVLTNAPALWIAYLRIRADVHYFSDVVAGAVVGMGIGYLISKHNLDIHGDENMEGDQGLTFSIPIVFPVGLKPKKDDL